MSEISILIIDDDAEGQSALTQVLDSEGWTVKVVPLASQAFAALASRDWTLVLVNVAMTDLSGPIFTTLKDLAQADVLPASGEKGSVAGFKRVRVLFLVPFLAARQAQPILESHGLPYALKPFHLHDFLEKISDLLLEAGAIEKPIRLMRLELQGKERRRASQRLEKGGREVRMFASREDYQMTEEELAGYEREEEERKKKEKELQKERERL